MLLEAALVALGIGEGRKHRSKAAEGPYEPELRGHPVNDETEPDAPSKVEPGFGLALYITERITRGKAFCDQVIAAISRKREIAEFVGRIEGAPHQAFASADGLRPGNNAVPEDQVDTGLEATQPALLHQVKAELTEAKGCAVFPEKRTEEHAKPDVGEARSIAVAMLQAEVPHPADDEAKQILVRKQSGGHYRGEGVHGRAPLGVGHRRQSDEVLDRATPDLAPE